MSAPAARPDAPALSGFLNIDKPPEMTSFDVVRVLRRAARIRRVGHAGTLDRPATGVLPVALGPSTRLIDSLVDARKRYRATDHARRRRRTPMTPWARCRQAATPPA